MLHDNWNDEELPEIALLDEAVQQILQAEWPALLPLNEAMIILPLAHVTLLCIGDQHIEREVGTKAPNDPSWRINVPAPNTEGVFVLSHEGWVSRPVMMARAENEDPVMIIDRKLSLARKLSAWLGSLLQFTANRPEEMSDVVFEAVLTRKLLQLLNVARDQKFANFSLDEEIASLESRFQVLNTALDRPRPEMNLASWEVAKMSFRGVCDHCTKETEFFNAKLDPMDPSSLGRAESRIDSEIGHGIQATCSHCGGPCNIVRTYMNEDLVEECTTQVFALGHGPKGEEPSGNYG